MSLPRYELGPEGRRLRDAGIVYSHVGGLLRELRAGIQELGVGDCGVKSRDVTDGEVKMFGFELWACYETPGVYAWWHFTIPFKSFLVTCRLLPDVVAVSFLTTEGRQRIAELLAHGVSAKGLAHGLKHWPSPTQPGVVSKDMSTTRRSGWQFVLDGTLGEDTPEPKMRELEVPPGMPIYRQAERLLTEAPAKCLFNDTPMFALPGEDVDTVLNRWQTERDKV